MRSCLDRSDSRNLLDLPSRRRRSGPEWTAVDKVLTISRAPTELSILCEEHLVPSDTFGDHGYRGFRVEGPLPLSAVGAMAAIAAPLASASVPIFPIATYDHDYIFLPGHALPAAIAALGQVAHRVVEVSA
jgi:uncharacterized protein